MTSILRVFLVSLVARVGWAALVLLITVPGTVWAQTCPPATPLGSGTTYQIPSGTSWSTIQSRMNSLVAGDNLLFQRGAVFNMTSKLLITRDGTASNKILIGAYGTGAAPIIDGSGLASTAFYGVHFSGANHVIWDGVNLRDMQNGQALTIEDDSRFITFRRSKIDGSRLVCIKIAQRSHDAVIEFNEVLRCGNSIDQQPAGSTKESVYVATDPVNTTTEDVVLRPIIRYNTFIDTDGGERVEFKGGTRNGIIEGNFIHGGNQGILISQWTNSNFQNAHKIRYNLIRTITGSSAVYGMAIRAGAEIHHNVVANVAGTSRPGIWIEDHQSTGQNITAHHNTVYNASGAAFSDGGGANTTFQANNLGWASGSGNFGSDPRFVNPAAYDFRLQSGSPANGFGAYTIGQALRPVGHTACDVTPPDDDPPAGTEIVADYGWDGDFTDASVAENDCASSGVLFGTPSPTQGAQYANFDASGDAIICPTKWHDPTQGTIRSLFNVSSCTHLAAGAPMYIYGESSSGTTPTDRKQIKVFNNALLGCVLTVGMGSNTSNLNEFAAVTPGTWYYIAITWGGGTLRAYLTPIASPVPTTEAGSAGYSGLTAKGVTYTWGNWGLDILDRGFRGGLKDSRVWNRLLSLSEIQADFTFVTGGGTTSPAVVTLDTWQVARADSPQDLHHFLASPAQAPATVPSGGCADMRVRVSVTDGDVSALSLAPTWRQDGTGPYGFLGDSDVGNLRLGQNLLLLNHTPTVNLLSTPSFVAGTYMTNNPGDAFTPITLTDGQSTELVVTACPKAGLTAPTYFELCFAELSGAGISCPTPPRINIGPASAWLKG